MTARWLDELRPRVEGQIDLDHVLGELVDELARQFDADRATFYLVDHAARELVSRAAHLPEIREIRLKLGEGVAGWVGQKGEAIRIGEQEPDHRFSRRIDAVTGYRTRSMMAVPVRDADHVIIGVLQVLNKRHGDFVSTDLQRLETVAVEVAKLLDGTSLRGQLRPDHDKPLSFRFNFIVGESAGMERIYDRVERAAATDATVLIRGETGTGKELIARAVHFNSERRKAPLVKVDCAALPESLIENELFGHEKGAFTGADREQDGKVAAAHGGTLFLDEIGELPLAVQGKLLRLVQDRTYLRVGGTRPRPVNVRFVCATHRDLQQMVEEGRFRADLYFRLRVVDIEVPPLRRRGHVDLDRLVDHFVFEYSRRYHREGLLLAPETRAALHAWSWPGNVRELEHCIESAVVLAPGNVITPDLLPFRSTPTARQADPPVEDPGEALFVTPPRTLEEVERAYVRYVLALQGGNRTRTAKVLGIGRNTLARKLGDDG
ncbi:MAG: sigma-54-dependent Fis family transcriptional regulator [Alphaproteobacteria bacterium]|nr:sigma-54-dependent Fis family transcriptional regulator [Alphaproteobacteria bacterium]MCB9698949.1 sigma-54-dependent Fis family transcriptional regulator [Alphaproteobacteria bacterium]